MNTYSQMPLDRRPRWEEAVLTIVHIILIPLTLVPVEMFSGSSNPLSKDIIDTFQRQDIISLTATINSFQSIVTTFGMSFLIDFLGSQYFLVPIQVLQLACAVGCAFCRTDTEFIVVQFIAGMTGEAVIMGQSRLARYFIPQRWQPVAFGAIFASTMLGHMLGSSILGPLGNLRQAYLICAGAIAASTIFAGVYTVLEVKRRKLEDLFLQYIAVAEASQQALLANPEFDRHFSEEEQGEQEKKDSKKVMLPNIYSITSFKYRENILNHVAASFPQIEGKRANRTGNTIKTRTKLQHLFTLTRIQQYLERPDTPIMDLNPVPMFDVSLASETDSTDVNFKENDSLFTPPINNRANGDINGGTNTGINLISKDAPPESKKSRRAKSVKCNCKDRFLGTIRSFRNTRPVLWAIMIPRLLVIGTVFTFNATSILSISAILNLSNEEALIANSLGQTLSVVFLLLSGLVFKYVHIGSIISIIIGVVLYMIGQCTLYLFGGNEKTRTVTEAEIVMSILGIAIGLFASNFSFLIVSFADQRLLATSLGLVFSLQHIVSGLLIPVFRYISTTYSYRETCWISFGMFALTLAPLLYGSVVIVRERPRPAIQIPTQVPESAQKNLTV